MEDKKRNAGYEAANYIKDGMIVGLGSGSTVNWMMKKLGEKVVAGLNIQGIPSSNKTKKLANQLGIPLIELTDDVIIDIAIDGADEIDPEYNLLKGGGGSLVREKLVDIAAKQFIVIADESKVVSTLGAFSLPVEILPFGWKQTAARIADLGGEPILRVRDNEVFVSDNGNYIVDCNFGDIHNPKALHENLKLLVGVVETGLFINMTNKIIIGLNDEVKYLTK